MREIKLTLTVAEAKALYGASYYVTPFYGPRPNPPTPAMTAQVKLEKALGLPTD